MSSDVAISVRDLNKIYGVGSKNEKVALNNISLQVKKGSIFGLLGPNGAGKSTFINILADLVRKTSGHIDIFGMSHHENLKDVKKLMGIVPQELNIDPFFTPYELLEIQAGLFGVPKKIHNAVNNRLKIPMKQNKRSLNLSSSVAIDGLYKS